MSKLERPLKNALREPVSAARSEAMWQNIRARRERRSLGWIELAAISAACACALALVAARVSAPTPGAQRELPQVAPDVHSVQTPPPAAGPLLLADGQAIPALHARTDARRMALADGSSIELSADTELLPRVSTGTQVVFELTRGRATFDVVPRGPRSWQVAAGEVQVAVLGTRFTVERAAGQVLVSVERGLVRVSSRELANGAQELHAGQALRASDGTQNTEVPMAQNDPTQQAPVAAVAPRAQVLRKVTSSAKDADALLELADAARVGGRARDASRALAQLVERFPEDPRAALAALTLGRIYLDQLRSPAQAARAFERANALGLPQALAEEGAARLVEAHAKAGHAQLARAAATSYLARFANGRRRTAVVAWVGTE